MSTLAERQPPGHAALADGHAPENYVERETGEQGPPRPGDRPCNDNSVDVFSEEGQNIVRPISSLSSSLLLITTQGEEPPSTLPVSGPGAVIETRGELQNEGEEAHERDVENLEHENRDEEQPKDMVLVVNPDKVHAGLDEEDSIVEDLRPLGLFCRSVRTFFPTLGCTD